MIRLAFLFVLALTAAAKAQDLRLPSNAELTADITEPELGGLVPIGHWQNGGLPARPFTGDLRQRAWRIDAAGLSSTQIIRSLREQFANMGFEVVFECEAKACGGFDFRFAIDVISPPNMLVNLADFQFFSAVQDGQAAFVIASRTREAGYIQVTQIGAETSQSDVTTSAPALRTNPTVASTDLPSQLEGTGRAVLDGLRFERGSARLSDGPFPSLDALAAFLSDAPTLNVALVGHTDSEGSLEGNIRLSKRRAGSVLERLVSEYGADRQQLAAEGMGYLAPIANNQSEEGREANRRVEVIITSTDN